MGHCRQVDKDCTLFTDRFENIYVEVGLDLYKRDS